MRSNGLTAADYAPLAELERSVAADALLALREVGVAAYAVLPDADEIQPAEDAEHAAGSGASGHSHGARNATVFADRTALERARAVVRELAPEAVPSAEASPIDEVAWQQIVSGFSATAREPDYVLPEGDDPPTPPRLEHQAPETEPHPLVRDDGEHYVPPPPSPGPGLDLVSRLAWGGLIGGPLVLLSTSLVSWAPPRGLVLLCMVAFVGGMVTLVLRMKDRPHDGDDGAVL